MKDDNINFSTPHIKKGCPLELDVRGTVNHSQMKNDQICNQFLILALVIWFGLVLCRKFVPQTDYALSKTIEIVDFILEAFTIIVTRKIYLSVKDLDKKIVQWLYFSAMIIIFVDLSWYNFESHHHTHLINHTTISSITRIFLTINTISYMLWTFFIIVFTTLILKNYILKIQKRIKTIVFFLIIDIILLGLYLYNIFYVESQSIVHIDSLLQLWDFILENRILEFPLRLLALNALLLCIIYAESRGLILYLMGALILTSDYIFITYIEFLQKSIKIYMAYADLFWNLGLIFCACGIARLLVNKDYRIKSWVQPDSTIRSIIVFSSFFFYTFIFFLCILLFYIFSEVYLVDAVIFPIVYIIYLPLVLYAFIQISKYLEKPFIQIIHNIECILSGTEEKQLKQFTIDEFRTLQNFIDKALDYKSEASELKMKLTTEKFEIEKREQDKFIKSIGQLVHDMNSPLEAINSFSNLDLNKIDESDKVNIKAIARRLSMLGFNLLNKYKNKDFDAAKKEEVIVALNVIQIVQEKELEYKSQQLTIQLDIAENIYFESIFINLQMFRSMLSNLLNNAIHAIKDVIEPKILVKVRGGAGNITLFIEDNGSGMPREIQDKFLQGNSVVSRKILGNGIGLTQVYDTIKSAEGNFKIYATNNVGTEIVIRFKTTNPPMWLATEIQLYPDDIIIIFDADPLIHESFANQLKSTQECYQELQIQYFSNGNEVVGAISKLSKEDKERVLLLADYGMLKSDLSGAEIIKISGIKRNILISNYTDEIAIQNHVIALMTKMLPKRLISHTPILVRQRFPLHSKVVDMVWMDDQEFYVNTLIKESYPNLKIDVYNDPSTFMNNIINYKFDTKIILDMNYEMPGGKLYHKTGLELAVELFSYGYSNIIILTGDPLDFYVPEYVKVILKSDEKKVKHLDQI